jgi:hypothetical protein
MSSLELRKVLTHFDSQVLGPQATNNPRWDLFDYRGELNRERFRLADNRMTSLAELIETRHLDDMLYLFWDTRFRCMAFETVALCARGQDQREFAVKNLADLIKQHVKPYRQQLRASQHPYEHPYVGNVMWLDMDARHADDREVRTLGEAKAEKVRYITSKVNFCNEHDVEYDPEEDIGRHPRDFHLSDLEVRRKLTDESMWGRASLSS